MNHFVEACFAGRQTFRQPACRHVILSKKTRFFSFSCFVCRFSWAAILLFKNKMYFEGASTVFVALVIHMCDLWWARTGGFGRLFDVAEINLSCFNSISLSLSVFFLLLLALLTIRCCRFFLSLPRFIHISFNNVYEFAVSAHTATK